MPNWSHSREPSAVVEVAGGSPQGAAPFPTSHPPQACGRTSGNILKPFFKLLVCLYHLQHLRVFLLAVSACDRRSAFSKIYWLLVFFPNWQATINVDTPVGTHWGEKQTKKTGMKLVVLRRLVFPWTFGPIDVCGSLQCLIFVFHHLVCAGVSWQARRCGTLLHVLVFFWNWSKNRKKVTEFECSDPKVPCLAWMNATFKLVFNMKLTLCCSDGPVFSAALIQRL